MDVDMANKSASDFWRRGGWVIALNLVQGIFAEDIVLTMNAEEERLSWFVSFMTVASQFCMGYLSMVLREQSQAQRELEKKRFGMNWGFWRSNFRWEYLGAAFSIVMYQLLNNNATFFLKFNSVQLFKTSKIGFVMFLGWVLLKHRFSVLAWSYAFGLGVGLYILSHADVAEDLKVERTVDDQQHQLHILVTGWTLMFFSMIFVALNNVLQEAVLRQHEWTFPWDRRGRKSSTSSSSSSSSTTMEKPRKRAAIVRDELIVFSNVMTSFVLGLGSLVTGELFRGIAFFYRHPFRLTLEQLFVLYVNAKGQRMMLDLSQIYGSSSATIVVTVRKTVTFALSALFFPKPFSFLHLIALCIVSIFATLLQLQLMHDEATESKKLKPPKPVAMLV